MTRAASEQLSVEQLLEQARTQLAMSDEDLAQLRPVLDLHVASINRLRGLDVAHSVEPDCVFLAGGDDD
jgi:hypothetical protein